MSNKVRLWKGGDEGSGTRSSLMYETVRLIKGVKPKMVIWENVSAILHKGNKHNNFNNVVRRKQYLEGFAACLTCRTADLTK